MHVIIISEMKEHDCERTKRCICKSLEEGKGIKA